jgi:hypothetical protein
MGTAEAVTDVPRYVCNVWTILREVHLVVYKNVNYGVLT